MSKEIKLTVEKSLNPLQVQTKRISACSGYIDMLSLNPLQVQTKQAQKHRLKSVKIVSIPYRYKQNENSSKCSGLKASCLNPLQVQTKHAQKMEKHLNFYRLNPLQVQTKHQTAVGLASLGIVSIPYRYKQNIERLEKKERHL